LQNEVNLRQKRSIRNQLVQGLTGKVQFDVPESTLQLEIRNVVYEMVNENQRRGVPKEIIESKKDEIYNGAMGIARERLKIGFLFHKISEKEGIRAEQHEMNTRIALMAQSNQMAPQKFLQELEKRGGVAEVYQQIIHEKVLDFSSRTPALRMWPRPSGRRASERPSVERFPATRTLRRSPRQRYPAVRPNFFYELGIAHLDEGRASMRQV